MGFNVNRLITLRQCIELDTDWGASNSNIIAGCILRSRTPDTNSISRDNLDMHGPVIIADFKWLG